MFRPLEYSTQVLQLHKPPTDLVPTRNLLVHHSIALVVGQAPPRAPVGGGEVTAQLDHPDIVPVHELGLSRVRS
jgi:hypothetical protein